MRGAAALFRIAGFVTLVANLTALGVAAEPRGFTIEAPSSDSRGVVLTLPWRETPPTEGLAVTLSSGERYPATIRDGTLIAVIPLIRAGQATAGSVETRVQSEFGSVRIERDAAVSVISVHVGSELVTRYWHDPAARKPYLWPLNTAGEVGITRDWPMGGRVKTIDHEHHQSAWTAHGDLNGADFWEYNEHTGWQQTEAIEIGSGDALGWIRAANVWVDAEKRPVIREVREFCFYNGDPDRRMIDVDVTLTAAYGDVHFGDTKEGGMIALRMRDELRERGGSGTITNSEGGVGAAQCWGKPAAWVDYSGSIEGAGTRGVAIFDHPSSFRHPAYWHARDYGLVAANPFGLNDFTEGQLNGDYTLKNGESLAFRYRMLLHTGDAAEAGAAEYYEGFANPPAARWTR